MEPVVTADGIRSSAAPMASPFVGNAYLADESALVAHQTEHMPGLVSPFAEALVDAGASEEEQLFEDLLGELQDESFDDAVEALVDEAAALDLSGPWASENGSGSAAVNTWAARVTADAHRLLEHLEDTFADRTLDSVTAGEIDLAAADFTAHAHSVASEQFFGGLVNKIKKVATKVAGAGLGVLAKFSGLSQVTALIRKLVDPLIRRVLGVLHQLPPVARGPAVALAAKLGVPQTAREVAEDFDRQFAQALTATSDATLDQALAEADEASVTASEDPVAALDVARDRLAGELAHATPGEPPIVQIEQFIPPVMAAMPLIRMAVRVLGRDRIKGLIARPLATFIAPYIGQQAARSLAPHITDAGMKLLRLEHEDPGALGAESLVSALEDTVREVLSLPAESLADDLRVGAEVQEAFAEAAARYLPSRVLRPDLEIGDPEGESGGWIMMPRTARPHFRYRIHSHPFRVRLSRPTASTIVFTEDETLEERLLDAGVTTWPAEAEVQLYEAMPGTHLGHLAAAEGDSNAEGFGELTPEVAGLLLQSPALGRRVHDRGRGRPAQPGQRFFQIVKPGQQGRRIRRFSVRLDLTTPKPVLRVHLRISERIAHAIAGQLDQRAHTQVITTMRGLLGPAARNAIAQRLSGLRSLKAPPGGVTTMAATLAEAMLTTMSKELPSAGAALATAARDPAPGATLTFAFPYPDRAALPAGTPGTPIMTIRPGPRRD